MISPATQQKQNAIYAALKPHLGEEQVLQALLIWHQDQAAGIAFSPRYFSDVAARLTGGRVAPKTLLVSLVAGLADRQARHVDVTKAVESYRSQYVQLSGDQNLAKLKEKLGLVSHRSIGARPGVKQGAYVLPEVSAFTALINKVLSLCDQTLAENVRLEVLKNLKSANTSPQLSGQLSLWLSGGCQGELTPKSVTTEDLRKVVTLFYAALCHFVGPVKADDLLSTSLARLESNGGAIYTRIFKQLL